MKNANAKKTHCVRGHLFDEKNTRLAKNGQRVCRACTSQHARAAAELRRAPESELDSKAVARLRDAWRDGVRIEDLSGRFGIGRFVVAELVRGVKAGEA